MTVKQHVHVRLFMTYGPNNQIDNSYKYNTQPKHNSVSIKPNVHFLN